MDIDAAFSSAKIENLVQNMKEHGVANTFVQWTKHLLENRQAFAKLGNNIAEKWIGRGTPQGYLISVILWNMVMNNLLKRFPKRHPTDLIVYADDGAACAIGIDEHTVVNLLQNDIKIMEEWATQHGLKFAVNKTKAMILRKGGFFQPLPFTYMAKKLNM